MTTPPDRPGPVLPPKLEVLPPTAEDKARDQVTMRWTEHTPFPRISTSAPDQPRFDIDVKKMLEQLANLLDKLNRNGAWITWKRHTGVLPVDINKTRQAFYAGWDAHRTRTKNR